MVVPREVLALVDRVHRHRSSYAQTACKEAQVCAEFIMPMFEAPEDYWDGRAGTKREMRWSCLLNDSAIPLGNQFVKRVWSISSFLGSANHYLEQVLKGLKQSVGLLDGERSASHTTDVCLCLGHPFIAGLECRCHEAPVLSIMQR